MVLNAERIGLSRRDKSLNLQGNQSCLYVVQTGLHWDKVPTVYACGPNWCPLSWVFFGDIVRTGSVWIKPTAMQFILVFTGIRFLLFMLVVQTGLL